MAPTYIILLWLILTDQTLTFQNAVGRRSREDALQVATTFHDDHADTIAQLCEVLRPRSRLKERHQRIFDDNSRHLFHRLGRLLACDQGVVSRKEFLETYAAASALHPLESCRRVADLAAGHGLLSWFLLVMDDDTRKESDRPLTAVCIDRRMPPSARVIATLLLGEFPHLRDRWSYIQADLSGIEPDPSCLLASVHACGALSDSIIASAIDHRAPLALVPCCHTIHPAVYQPHPLYSQTTVAHVTTMVQQRKLQDNNNNDNKHQVIADVVDAVRCRTLENAGFRVDTTGWLPPQFTARNRWIVAMPPEENGATTPPQLFPWAPPFPPLLRIPLADTVEDMASCHQLASATQQSIHDPPPFKYTTLTLAVNVWLPEDNGQNNNTVMQMIQAQADQCCSTEDRMGTSYGLACRVTASGLPRSSSCGRQQQLYQVQYYRVGQENLRGASRRVAKQVHVALKERLGDHLVVVERARGR